MSLVFELERTAGLVFTSSVATVSNNGASQATPKSLPPAEPLAPKTFIPSSTTTRNATHTNISTSSGVRETSVGGRHGKLKIISGVVSGVVAVAVGTSIVLCMLRKKRQRSRNTTVVEGFTALNTDAHVPDGSRASIYRHLESVFPRLELSGHNEAGSPVFELEANVPSTWGLATTSTLT